jgi:pyrimidine-nucleoside phosphorylase
MVALMSVPQIILKKRGGEENSFEELKTLIEGYLEGRVQEGQIAAWLMAVYFRGLSKRELKDWTSLMWHSGITLPRENKNTVRIDKHSVGGVGDKTSLILVPLVTAACEKLYGKGRVKIPMVSGRGLSHSGGTLDKLESVPGFSPSLSVDKLSKLLETQSFFMAGQTGEIAPADRLLYALRDVTGTVDCLPLIVSSIMSKKLAENLDGLVIDLKTGDGAFMQEKAKAKALGKALVEVARAQKVEAVAVMTRMDEPLGFKVGNHLEVEECADFLTGKSREAGLSEVVLELASWMTYLGGRKKLRREKCREACEEALSDPRVFQIFTEMFKSQGGNWDAFLSEGERLRQDWKEIVWKSPRAGKVSAIPARAIGHFLNDLGGGRNRKEDAIDHKVGFEFFRKVGDPVKKGEAVVRVFCSASHDPDSVRERLGKIIKISGTAHRKRWVIGALQ